MEKISVKYALPRNPLKIILIAVDGLLFLVTAIFNALGSGAGRRSGLYINSTGGVSDFYFVDITPASYAFSIWGLIYFMQIVMIIYFVVNIFRKNPVTGGYLCCNPNYISSLFLCIYGSSYIFNIAWILIFDRSILNPLLLGVCAFILWITFFTLALSLVIHFIDFHRETQQLIEENLRLDIWLTVILVQNGIALYATWCSVAAPLNTALSLAYIHKIPQADASTIALSILVVEIVLYVCLDTFVLDRWTRFTITPHCVLVWALTASIVKNYQGGKRNSIFTAILLALAVFAVVEKIILIIWRQWNKPMYRRNPEDFQSTLVGMNVKVPQ